MGISPGPEAFNGGWALNWKRSGDEEEIFETTKLLISLRKKYLSHVTKEFFTGEMDLGTNRKDLAWFRRNGDEMTAEDWQTRAAIISPCWLKLRSVRRSTLC